SSRNWEAEDQTYLQTAFETLAQILKQSEQHTQPVEVQAIAAKAMDTQLEQLRQENQKLLVEIESLRRASDTDALLTLQREAEELIKTLQTENEQLRARLDQPAQTEAREEGTEGQEYLEKELRLALEEVARLQNALAGANMKILTLEMQTKRNDALVSEQHELLSAIVQQLRQSLSFITGYTDLLLSEAVGILGSMQRKFMERIATSTERMNKLLDDLIHIAVLQDVSAETLQQSVDVNTVIDQAVASITPELQEKNIAL
ncbi:MAG: histidine kinase dimerization/phospho-acceptor domain-containing protein, partial [Anaerolineales bacterium]